MKKLLLLIILILNLVLLQAQDVKFISVNSSLDSLENITFKRLPKLLEKDFLIADTLTTPYKWMVKLQKKLSKEQRQDSNIYIFFCPTSKDSLKAYLPLSGKYGYVLFDTAKVSIEELEKVQKKLSTHKYQWDLIHDPETILLGFMQNEEEGAMGAGPLEKIIIEQVDDVVLKVVWRRASEEALKKVGKQAAKKLTVGTVIRRTSIWIAAWELFVSGSSSPQYVASDSYETYFERGLWEEFWELWVGPGRNFPLPPTVVGDELNQWLVDYWPEDVGIDLTYVQSHHVLPNSLLRGVKPNDCFQQTFSSNYKEYDKIWNRIDLPTSVHYGSHPHYNKYVKKKIEDFLDDMMDLVDCGTIEMEDAIKKFADEMRKELMKNIQDNPGKEVK